MLHGAVVGTVLRAQAIALLAAAAAAAEVRTAAVAAVVVVAPEAAVTQVAGTRIVRTFEYWSQTSCRTYVLSDGLHGSRYRTGSRAIPWYQGNNDWRHLMRKISSISALALLVIGLFGILPRTTAAQDDDPPGRVARLNYLQGSISYQVSGDQDWVQADPNRPLTTGDNLWADQNSRGEVHIGSTAIRLSSETGLSFLTLDDGAVQLQLAQGTIEVHLRTMSDGDVFEVDTPNLAFTLDRPGEYRIATDPNGDSTIITVRDGQGEVTGGNVLGTLRAGQRYAFNGTDQLSYNAVRAPGLDDFENWCQSRNLREENSVSAKYVSRDVDGYYDLDQYGDWGNDSEYGSVWYPRGIASDWSPYHVGHWVYVDPWGWTWVDEEPWGFAPFHYGRWAYVRNRWGWVPGPVAVRPVYAPALVAFVGGGGWICPSRSAAAFRVSPGIRSGRVTSLSPATAPASATFKM